MWVVRSMAGVPWKEVSEGLLCSFVLSFVCLSTTFMDDVSNDSAH